MGVDWTEGSKQCELMVDYIKKVSGGVFTFDATQFNYEWQPIVDDFLANCTQKDMLYEALHIDQSTKIPMFEDGSQRVSDAYQYELYLDWSRFYD